MDIRLPAWVGERNKDPIPPPKYRCFSRCPVPDCHKQRNLRRHVMEAHLPFRFRLEGLMDMNWHSRRICSLEKLAELVLGTRSLDYLMEWANKAGYIPPGTVLGEQDGGWVRAMSEKAGWECPDKLSLAPVNCVALVAHWRVLVAILAIIPPEYRDEFAHQDDADRRSGIRRQYQERPQRRGESPQGRSRRASSGGGHTCDSYSGSDGSIKGRGAGGGTEVTEPGVCTGRGV